MKQRVVKDSAVGREVECLDPRLLFPEHLGHGSGYQNGRVIETLRQVIGAGGSRQSSVRREHYSRY